MNRPSARKWSSAAARRLRRFAGDSPTVESAVLRISNELLRGVPCPPTDLDAIMPILNVVGCEHRDDFAGSGALIRHNESQFKIIYSSLLSHARKRWTIAHELGHAVFEMTGANPPRKGQELERLCDMIATELLLPRESFMAHIFDRVDLDRVLTLSNLFQTSVSATAIRCAELGGVSVFETDAGRLRWGYGSVRNSFHLASNEPLRAVVCSAGDSERGKEEIDLSIGQRKRRWVVEWKRIGIESRRLFVLRLAQVAERNLSASVVG